MKTQLVVFILSLFSVGLLASVQEDDRVVFASRDYAPHTWKVHPAHLYNSNGPHQNELITFRVLLKKNNLDLLEKTFWEVNTPTSPKYGQFLTKAEIDTLIAPSTESKERVASWLKKYSLTKFREEADFFEVTCPVLIAEKMFRTRIIPFTQQTRVLNRIMGDASIPRALVDDIELVSGLSELFSDQTKYSPNRPAHTGSESTVTNVMEELYAARNPEDKPQAASTNVGEDLLVTPSLIRSYYSIPANQKSSYSGNSQGIAAFDDYFSSGALDAFAQDQGYPSPSVTRVGPICFPHKCDQFESDLDIQYVTAIGMNTATQFINHDKGLWILGWTQELSAMTSPALVQSVSYGWSELQQCDIATTKCQTLGYTSQQYVLATNIEFQKLGARGLSIFVSDGDDGAASLGAASGNCPLDPSVYCIAGGCRHSSTSCGEITINAGGVKCFWPMGVGSAGCAAVLNQTGVNALNVFFNKNQPCRVNIDKDARGNLYFYSACSCSSLTPTTAYGYTVSGYSFDPNNGPLFTADYPTSSPYVTSVGATQFVSSGGQIQKEIVASVRTGAIITTGGGFSSFQPQPSYQKAAVAGFLNSGASLPPSFSYNVSNRAYPDITLVGHNYKVFVSTNEQNPAQCPCTSTGVDGTSASSPAVAGFFTLINDQLLSNGGTPLGFLNPLLYQIYSSSSYSQVFNDIVEGDNKCTRSYCCKYGWAASSGWDPVSGIGSPKWSALSSYILNLKLKKQANKINLN